MTKEESLARGYEATFEQFDTPLMQKVRREAYGEDIGQHSWVTADELRESQKILALTKESQVLDFGCGPGGPTTFLAKEVGCHIIAVDISAAALAAGKRRCESMNLSHAIDFHELDANTSELAWRDLDAIISFDVVLHLEDRLSIFRKLASVLRHRGKLLLTDAGVVTGPLSHEEIRRRSVNGYTQFVPPGYNEQCLEECGLRILSTVDRTSNVVKNALGRLSTRNKYASELIPQEGEEKFRKQQSYLETVVRLSERKSLSRISYLAEADKSG